ncbi:hypothetical protein BsWGS_11747 [Bradybaena similaris]
MSPMGCITPNVFGSLWLSIVYFLLLCGGQAKRCSYGLYSHDFRLQELDSREARRFGVKDCTWGCCWDNSHDICCPFPLEIALVVLISTLCLIIIIAVIVGLVKYLLSRRRRPCVHVNGSVCRHGILGNFGAVMYQGSSTILHQSYIQLDSEAHPGLAAAVHSSDTNLAAMQGHRRPSKQGESAAQLLPAMPEGCTSM